MILSDVVRLVVLFIVVFILYKLGVFVLFRRVFNKLSAWVGGFSRRNSAYSKNVSVRKRFIKKEIKRLNMRDDI